MKHVLLRIAGHTIRWTWVATIVLSIVAVIGYGVARFYLPTLLQDKSSIENTLERLSGQKIAIGKIEPWWDGIFPGVRAEGVRVSARGGVQSSITLDEVRVSISLLPLLRRKITIHNLVVVHPQVVLQRLRGNRVGITGFGAVKVDVHSENKTREATEDNVFVAWLFAQRRMAIEDGVLVWIDNLEPKNRVQSLTRVGLSLENHGQQHHLSFTADFPEDMCDRCALDVDIEGNPLAGPDWGGRVNIDAIGLNIDALPLVMRTEIPKEVGGRLNLKMRTQWAGGVPRVAQGLVDARDLRLPGIERGQGEIHVDRLRAGIQWRGRLDAWQLDIKNTLIGLGGTPWDAGYIRVDHSPALSRLQIRRVDLAKLARYATQLGFASNVSEMARSLRPAGTIENLVVQYDQRGESAAHWMAQGRLNEIHFEPYKKLPGIDGFSGFLLVTDQTGELRVDTSLATFRLPWMFRQPIPLRRVLGRVRWQRKADHWSVTARDLRLAGDAIAQGDMQAEIPFDHEKSPHLKMHFSFFGGDVSTASRYYPVNKLHKKLLTWLDQAIVSGEIVGGHLDFDGPTRDYPFKHGEGKFEVQARVHDLVLNYLEGWPAMRGVDGTLLFRGPGMLITADSGRIRDLQVSGVVAHKTIVGDKSESVVVTGRIVGPVATAMDVLRHVPESRNGFQLAHMIAPGLVGSGDGALNLHIDIPHEAHTARVDGEYRFLGGGLQLPVEGVRFTDMRGAIRFSHAGIDDGEVHAKLFNQAAIVDARTETGRSGKETIFRARGSVRASDLAATYGEALGRLISGSTTWNGELRLQDGAPRIQIQSDLAGLRTSLPAPFNSLSTDAPHTILTTVVSDANRNLLRMQLGNGIGGLFDFRQRDGEWRFDSGQIVLGGIHAQLPGRPGLEALLRGGTVDGDPWITFVRAGSGEAPAFLTRVSASVKQLTVFGRQLGPFTLGLNRVSGGWTGSVGGQAAEGAVALKTSENGTRINLDLDLLRLPKQLDKPSGGDSPDPRAFPSVELRSKRFINEDRDWGAIDLSAIHTELGLRIVRLNLERPEMRLRSSGTWYVVVGHDSVDYNVNLQSSDMEKTLGAFGLGNMLQGGQLTMNMGVHWRADPDRPGLRNLDGTVNVNVKNGSFLNVNQGAASLAGLFNLRSLAEMLTLNFKSATGFAFSDITGRVAIHEGVAYTDGISVQGSSANIVARGRANLVNQKVDLVAEIYPNLRAPVTFASGWLWGPQTAALVLALQEIFHKDIEQGTRITYKITGTMNKPKVTKTAGSSNSKSTAR